MKFLFINTATANLVVAIVINKEVRYIYNKFVGQDMSKVTVSIIKDAFDKTNINPRDIDKVFVVTGPGSFTGIRIGLTFAKVMCYCLNIEIIPISTLEVIASTNTEQNNLALIDARRGYVYAGGYDSDLNNIFADRYVLFDGIDFDGQLISYDDVGNSIKPNIDILKIILKHEKDKGVNPHSLNPNYLKLTEAEEKLKNDNSTK